MLRSHRVSWSGKINSGKRTLVRQIQEAARMSIKTELVVGPGVRLLAHITFPGTLAGDLSLGKFVHLGRIWKCTQGSEPVPRVYLGDGLGTMLPDGTKTR